ncbi:Uma2 family endonuclease [Leptothoe sp. LEGE 181152]|nr:Uma2 family endonuclease [Leptothoe sp. LEGE 181152]
MLSKSTEAFDREDKFATYQTLESLQEYVLFNRYNNSYDTCHLA